MNGGNNTDKAAKICTLLLVATVLCSSSVAHCADTASPGVQAEDVSQLERAATAMEKEIAAIDELQSLLQLIVIPDTSEAKAGIVRSLLQNKEKNRG
jgi:hypothetical protein